MSKEIKEAVDTVVQGATAINKVTLPLQDKLMGIIDSIQHSIVSVAPQAMEITLSVTRFECVMHLLSYGILMLIGGILLKKARPALIQKGGLTNDYEVVIVFVACVFSGVFSIVTLACFNMW